MSLPTNSRIAEEIAPTLQAASSEARGGTEGPLVLIPASACSPGSAASTTDSHGPGFDISRSVRATLTDATCSEHDGPESPSARTYEAWHENQNGELSCQGPIAAALGAERSHNYQWISSRAEHHAKTCPSPDSDEDSCRKADDRISSSSTPESLTLFDPAGFCGRTFLVPSLATAVGTSEQSLERWPTSGTAWPGGFSTHVSSECRSDEDGCSSSEPSLTQILEPPQNVPARYSLSARAARGILRRAQKRGRTLPEHLARALREVAAPVEAG